MANKNYPLYETTVFEDFRIMTENVANRFPDRIAYGFKLHPRDKEWTTRTFSECREYIRGLGTALISLGARDKKVALIGECSFQWVMAYFALMSIGAVTVPVDKELPAPDMGSILNTAECEIVCYSSVIDQKIAQLRTEIPSLKHLVCLSAETTLEDVLKTDALAEEGKAAYEGGDNSYYDYEIDTERLASIVFTSGTTGKGKGVMLSTKNIVSDMTQGMYNFQISYRTMMVLPPHHTFGSTVNLVGHFSQGATVYLSAGLKYILNELKDVKPQHLVLVPLFVETFYKRIWATVEKQGKTKTLKNAMKVSGALRKVGIDMRRKLFSSVLEAFGGELEMIICGGAALNQDIIDTFDAIGITILNGYGITECAPLISCNRNKWQKRSSVGTPIIGEEVRILDPDETGAGEIAVKGPNVMLGYYKDPEATAAAFTEDGFFKTGDLGRLDEDGWIYITGRSKNLIILSNGKNVYPEEIETEISRIPGTNEVVVYEGKSVSAPEKELIVAEIYPDFDYLKAHGIEDAQAYYDEEMKKVNASMVSYKNVHRVKIRQTEFEKNTSKKIIRFKIDKTVD